MKIQGKSFSFFGLFSVIFLSSCGGGGNGDDAVTVTSNANDSAFISGQVIDGITGEPIVNALVTTTPPTEARLTDQDGRYEIRDDVFDGEVFDVTARQIGYNSDSRRVTVANGSFAIADFSITTAINGLVASVPSLEIPRDEVSQTFLLSSTIPDTPFSFTTTNPDFQVTPSNGNLSKNEHLIIQVDFLPESTDSGRITGQLVANTANGGTGLEIDVVGNVSETDASAPVDPFEILLTDPVSVGVGVNQTDSTQSEMQVNQSADETEPGGIISSTFDNSADLWLLTGNSPIQQPEWEADESGEGGFVCLTDTVGETSWYIVAPPRFTGDLSVYYGTLLQFDVKTLEARIFGGVAEDPDLIIRSGDDELTLTGVINGHSSEFMTFSTVLVELEWLLNGEMVSRSRFMEILSSVDTLLIKGDTGSQAFNQDSDRGCLDNIMLGVPR